MLRKHAPGCPCCECVADCDAITNLDVTCDLFSWTVDLGAGGWTNAGSTACTGRAGEFTLFTSAVPGPSCLGYAQISMTGGGPCTGSPPHPDSYYGWGIELSLINNPDGAGWLYKVRTYVYGSGGGRCDPDSQSMAIYFSAVSCSEDCLDLADPVTGKIALTKDTETHEGDDETEDECCWTPCGGSTSETIYAWPDA